MPLDGEYAPSTAGWARKRAERYEATHGQEANDLRGRPIIVLTSVGAKTGKLRKTALMPVEHEGVETWPDYAKYQNRTERQIPVFVLEPIDDDPDRRP